MTVGSVLPGGLIAHVVICPNNVLIRLPAEANKLL